MHIMLQNVSAQFIFLVPPSLVQIWLNLPCHVSLTKRNCLIFAAKRLFNGESEGYIR
jgi:hypothetical protein